MKNNIGEVTICAWQTLWAIVVFIFFAAACTRSGDSELSWDELNEQVQLLINQAIEQSRTESHDAEAQKISKGIALTLKTIEAKERDARRNQADLAKMYRLAGYLEEYAGDQDEALLHYKRALEYAVKEYGSNHFEVAESLYWVSTSSAGNINGGDALDILGQAVGIMDKEREREHSGYNPELHIRAIDVYGRLLRERGAYGEVSIVYETAFDILDSMNYMPEEGLQILRSGARYYMNNNMHTQALPFVERQLAHFEQELARDSDDPSRILVATSLTDLAIIYTKQGRYKDAGNMYERAIHIYERVVGTDDILTKRCRDHMEYMQRKRDGKELLDDDPPPYIYPRRAKINEYQRIEQDDSGAEELNANEVLLDEIAGLSSFVSNYVSLVRGEDLESLYELLHPKVRDGLSEEQEIALMMFDVRSHLRNIDVFTVDWKAVSRAEMAEIEDRAIHRGSQYVVRPQVKVSITIERGQHSRVIIPVYASNYGDEWYMVQPVPGEERTKQLYDIYRELVRKSQSQSESPNNPSEKE